MTVLLSEAKRFNMFHKYQSK